MKPNESINQSPCPVHCIIILPSAEKCFSFYQVIFKESDILKARNIHTVPWECCGNGGMLGIRQSKINEETKQQQQNELWFIVFSNILWHEYSYGPRFMTPMENHPSWAPQLGVKNPLWMFLLCVVWIPDPHNCEKI